MLNGSVAGAVVKQKARGVYCLILEGRGRWGTWAEISADIAYLLDYGRLPPPARGSWA